jgi:hypothetical protein
LELAMKRTPLWQTIVAIALVPILIPLAALAGLFSKPIRRTPGEVADYLSDFIEDRSGPCDWDDFTSLRIADPALDAIRMRATEIDLRTNVDGEKALRQLLAEARSLQRTSK